MAFRRPRKLPQFADLKPILAQTKEIDEALYQVIEEILDRLSNFQFETDTPPLSPTGGGGGGGGANSANKFATYHTKQDETTVLPNAVQLLAGAGIVFDDSVANKRTISGSGAGGAHAPTHSQGGTDPVDVKNLAGYPGGTTSFLRADKTFAVPPGGGAGGMNLDYLGNYTAGPVYNDGDIVIGPDSVAYMCVVDGTTTPPEPWPGTGIISSQGPAGPQGPPGPSGTGPIGTIVMWGGGGAPSGWFLCQGGAVPRASYPELFAAIGTNYGAGDGFSTFNLPNFMQRFPLGLSPGGTGAALGQAGGVIDHGHNVASHAHGVGSLTGAAHTHGVTALSIGSHSHDQGSLTVASHTHGPGSLQTEAHNHGGSAGFSGSTDSTGSHSHGMNFTSDYPDLQITIPTSGGGSNYVASRSDHRHTINGSTGSTGNHSHGFSGSVSIGNESRLLVTGGVTSASSPGLSGYTGAASAGVAGAVDAAGVGISGATAAAGATTDANNPPYLVVNFIIRAL